MSPLLCKHLIRLGCHLSGRHGGLGVVLRGRGELKMKGGGEIHVAHSSTEKRNFNYAESQRPVVLRITYRVAGLLSSCGLPLSC